MKKKLLLFLLTLCLAMTPLFGGVETKQAQAAELIKTFDLSEGVTLRKHETVSLAWTYMKKGDTVKTRLTSTDKATIGLCSLSTGNRYTTTHNYIHKTTMTITKTGYYKFFIYNECDQKITCTGMVYQYR